MMLVLVFVAGFVAGVVVTDWVDSSAQKALAQLTRGMKRDD